MAARVVAVAKEALLCLYERVAGMKEDHKPGEEAAVLRNLIKITAGNQDIFHLFIMFLYMIATICHVFYNNDRS